MTGLDSIGRRLAQLRREMAARERRDIPQHVAADEIGASAGAYSRWESDLRTPNDTWLAKLARYYGTTVPFIHYGVGGKEKPAERGGLEDITIGAVPLTLAQKARAVEKDARKTADQSAAKKAPKGRIKNGGRAGPA